MTNLKPKEEVHLRLWRRQAKQLGRPIQDCHTPDAQSFDHRPFTTAKAEAEVNAIMKQPIDQFLAEESGSHGLA